MPDLQDQHYLALEQYKDSSHLKARITLHQRFSVNQYGWFKWVFDQFILPLNANILEIGCGPGTLWRENITRIPVDWHVTLSDFSPGMVCEAKGIKGFERKSFSFEVSDGLAIPFPTEIFDAVIANHVLYHIPHRVVALAEINRVLKPGGRFFASTIGENHFLELSQIMEGFTPTGRKYYSPGLNPGGFTLENGSGQLTPWFKQVEVRHYPDALVITEAEPLIAYILSMITWADSFSNEESITKLTSIINRMIKQHGTIRIQKCSGMFVCEKRGLADE